MITVGMFVGKLGANTMLAIMVNSMVSAIVIGMGMLIMLVSMLMITASMCIDMFGMIMMWAIIVTTIVIAIVIVVGMLQSQVRQLMITVSLFKLIADIIRLMVIMLEYDGYRSRNRGGRDHCY
jgi:hypothetical protein